MVNTSNENKTVVRRSLILKYFSKELYLKIWKVNQGSNLHAGDKQKIINQLLKDYNIEYTPLGSGTNRYVVQIDSYAVKFALDRAGMNDNKREMIYSTNLQPYVAKTYECDPGGLISVSEYVRVFTLDDMNKKADEMRKILKIASDQFLIGDVGVSQRNYINWGERILTGEICMLDFAYIYSVDYMTFQCRCTAAPFLKYDDNFNELICPVCGKHYQFREVQGRVSREIQKKETDQLVDRGYKLTSPCEEVIYNKDFEYTNKDTDEEKKGKKKMNSFKRSFKEMEKEEKRIKREKKEKEKNQSLNYGHIPQYTDQRSLINDLFSKEMNERMAQKAAKKENKKNDDSGDENPQIQNNSQNNQRENVRPANTYKPEKTENVRYQPGQPVQAQKPSYKSEDPADDISGWMKKIASVATKIHHNKPMYEVVLSGIYGERGHYNKEFSLLSKSFYRLDEKNCIHIGREDVPQYTEGEAMECVHDIQEYLILKNPPTAILTQEEYIQSGLKPVTFKNGLSIMIYSTLNSDGSKTILVYIVDFRTFDNFTNYLLNTFLEAKAETEDKYTLLVKYWLLFACSFSRMFANKVGDIAEEEDMEWGDVISKVFYKSYNNQEKVVSLGKFTKRVLCDDDLIKELVDKKPARLNETIYEFMRIFRKFLHEECNKLYNQLLAKTPEDEEDEEEEIESKSKEYKEEDENPNDEEYEEDEDSEEESTLDEEDEELISGLYELDDYEFKNQGEFFTIPLMIALWKKTIPSNLYNQRIEDLMYSSYINETQKENLYEFSQLDPDQQERILDDYPEPEYVIKNIIIDHKNGTVVDSAYLEFFKNLKISKVVNKLDVGYWENRFKEDEDDVNDRRSLFDNLDELSHGDPNDTIGNINNLKKALGIPINNENDSKNGEENDGQEGGNSQRLQSKNEYTERRSGTEGENLDDGQESGNSQRLQSNRGAGTEDENLDDVQESGNSQRLQSNNEYTERGAGTEDENLDDVEESGYYDESEEGYEAEPDGSISEEDEADEIIQNIIAKRKNETVLKSESEDPGYIPVIRFSGK